jgi:CheY-like chemotaxis protein
MITDKDKIILLVEDNPDDVELTRRAFKKNNLLNEIVVVRDGAEAIEVLFNEGSNDLLEKLELVLLDLKLPKIDGLEVLKRIRKSKKTKYIPVVILTSSKYEQDLVNGYKFGANSYIRKPVDFVKFVEAAKQLGLYWLLLNISPPK